MRREECKTAKSKAGRKWESDLLAVEIPPRKVGLCVRVPAHSTLLLVQLVFRPGVPILRYRNASCKPNSNDYERDDTLVSHTAPRVF